MNKKKIINYCIKYLRKKKKIEIINDSNIFFCSFAKCISNSHLIFISKPNIKNFFKNLTYQLVNIIGCFKIKSFDIILPKNFKYEDKTIYITYAKLNDLNKEKKFIDRYFQYKEKKSVNLVIYQDAILPKNIPSNCIILYQNNKININPIKYILIGNLNLFNFSRETYISYLLVNKITKILDLFDNISCINTLYEGQNFQLNLINKAKKKKIQINGFVHSILPALPTNLIFKKISPDKLFVSGEDTPSILKYLGWNEKIIHQIKSIRFFKSKKIKKNMCNVLFLPIDFKNEKFYENLIINFFTKHPEYLNKKIIVKKHPAFIVSTNCKKFINNIQSYILRASYNKKYQNKNISFFVGSTSSVIEALERGLEVIHFIDNDIFQHYSNDIFKKIISQKICENVYSYRLTKRNSYLKLR